MGLDIQVSVSAVTVFAQGLLSFFSPCVLPLLPLYIGYLSGGASEDAGTVRKQGRTMLHTFFFVLGVSAAFFLLGLGMSAVGRFFGSNRVWFARIGGVIVILLGLYQMGLFQNVSLLGTERRLPLRLDKMVMSPFTAFLMGFVFSFAWTPCVGPALSGVLLMAASSASGARGFLLIGVYTLGFVIPFLALGIFTEAILAFLGRHRNALRCTTRIGGALLILMGILMITGAAAGLSGLLASADTGSPQSAGAVPTAEAAVFPAETPTPTPAPANIPTAEPEPEPTPEPSPMSGPEPTPETTRPPTPEPDAVPPEADRPVYPAYDFSLYDQYGQLHTLSDYRGKVIFLNLWTTWCPYCIEEMPDIQLLYEKYGTDESGSAVILGAAFPGLAGEGDEETVKDFLAENGFTYPVLMDPEGELLSYYGVSEFPTTFMIDPEGNLYGYVPGAMPYELMEEVIRQTLAAGGLS